MRKVGLISVGIMAAGVAIAATHDVSRGITQADRDALATLPELRALSSKPLRSLRDEVEAVIAVQDSILTAAPLDKEIPHGQPREIADVLQARQGLCYDRSRAIETALRALGFETRHAAIYSVAETGSAWRSLATPGVESHAVTEVRTRAGWMLVDSNQRWIGLTAEGRPIDLAALRRDQNRTWSKLVSDAPNPIFSKPFTWAYGLYSRHGRFYAPYNPVPDVSWPELLQNI